MVINILPRLHRKVKRSRISDLVDSAFSAHRSSEMIKGHDKAEAV